MIGQATWYGIYLDSALANGTPNTSSWQVSFYADAAGVPGAQLSNTTLNLADVTVQNLGTGFFGAEAVTVYQFSANLSPFAATAATTYWFSPWSNGPTFFNLLGLVAGTGGDNATYQESLSAGSVSGTFVRGSDRAFSLAEVPEPSTNLLILSGIGVLALLRRRRA
ncbi:PEP-CTERM sorting domain-containing protein [Paludibaculum fermentans]|uniref:PEP-CTERM sorting domain-containing protein n=1 Tax=Paludibaculum fermentans TaxID=1473598 RepID=A0A7S7NVG2_PALFE|nr:PEP-CTERM sorting domain-containing protein [Paludibaculum fermentans]QOY90529.1 PEP-CTERM sorting domain-containing protein [Paludibaculum fermentans]